MWHSERNPRAKTPLARLVRPNGTRDEAESGAVYVARRVSEVSVISRIQSLCAELESQALGDQERAIDAPVSLEEAGSAQIVSARISESLGRAIRRIVTDINLRVSSGIKVRAACGAA